MMKSSECSKEPEIIGQAYQELKSLVKKYSKEEKSILFVGESGTGKELFANLYMEYSERKGENRTINCATPPDGGLLSSEIFGHVKGAFTGAVVNRPGKLATCNGGVLFLDELGDASTNFQAAILRVSEGGSYSQVGSDKELNSNTVIIAATNKPSQIRPELKKRFHILPIPPLQKSDIPELAKHFLGGKDLNGEFINELMARDWPFNVRQLENYCERQLVENQSLFAKGQNSTTIVNYQSFDYHRYRQEFETWDEHIQPILDNHKIDGFKYTYQEWKDKWDDYEKDTNKQLKDILLLRPLTRDEDRNSKGLINLINYINTGVHKENDDLFGDHKYHPLKPSKIVPRFRQFLRKIIELELLPYVLLQIQRSFCPNSIHPTKPSLHFLLDVVPYNEAQFLFKKLYYDYHINLHGSASATASALRLKRTTLKTTLRRIKIKT